MKTSKERREYINGAIERIDNQLTRLSLTSEMAVEDGAVEAMLKELGQLQRNLDKEKAAYLKAHNTLVSAAAQATEMFSEDELEEYAKHHPNT